MFPFTHRAARAIAAATIIGTFAFGISLTAGSALAQAPAPQVMADASVPATTEPAAVGNKADPVEARIKELHNKLHITAAQQSQWDNLVEIMRGNARTMKELQKERGEDATSMTAVDAVRSYAAVIDAHQAGMTKFVPAFEALYNTMSDAQKHTADSMFQNKVVTASATAAAK
ncbi:MAG: Spy/CpxP family protein refolding chaperone [Candidatus Binataceae bacterium]